MEIIVIVILAAVLLGILARLGKVEERSRETISGEAYVTDGDGIRVGDQNIRLASLDAPEWDQPAMDRSGEWFDHGKQVKSALIRAIGGKHVQVVVDEYDKYGRAVGVVTCDGKDVGEWLVRNGYAIAAYGDRYENIEREARKAKRGMWGLRVAYDPRSWRHRDTDDEA